MDKSLKVPSFARLMIEASIWAFVLVTSVGIVLFNIYQVELMDRGRSSDASHYESDSLASDRLPGNIRAQESNDTEH